MGMRLRFVTGQDYGAFQGEKHSKATLKGWDLVLLSGRQYSDSTDSIK